MNKYVWDEWKGATRGSRSAKEQPKDINKDMPDCIRYLCMSNPLWFDPFQSDEELPITFRPR